MMINDTPSGANPVCGSMTCTSDTPNHSHLSMPDPCPHFTRLDFIRANLANDIDKLDYMNSPCSVHEADLNDQANYLMRNGN